MAAPTNMFSKHPDMDTGQAWASKTTHMSGGWTWDHLKLTHMRIMCIELHPSRLISKIHIWGWGWGLGLGLGLGLGHELRNRAPCNNGSRQANRLASNNNRASQLDSQKT